MTTCAWLLASWVDPVVLVDNAGERTVSRQRRHHRHALRRAAFSKFLDFLKANCTQYAEIY